MTSQLRLDMDSTPKARRTAALEHFVPTGQSPAEALAGEDRAAGQEALILMWMEDQDAGARFTPWAIADELDICINSVRRALTMLTKRGLLVADKRNRVPAGPYGQKSGTWRLSESPR